MTTNTFDPTIIPRIAEALDPERKLDGWWEGVPEEFVTCAEYYTGPTTAAAAKAAFEPVVREMDWGTVAVMVGHLEIMCHAAPVSRLTFPQWMIRDMTAAQYLTALANALEVG